MKHLQISRIAKLINLNTRVEKHGPEDVTRADLDFSTTISCDDIARLYATEYSQNVSDSWRALLFFTKHDLGGELLRFLEHNIKSISFDREFKDHQLSIDAPAQPRMRFDDVKICKFRVDFDYDDHSLVLHFQAQIAPQGLLDELANSLKRTVTVNIDPPDEKRQADMLKKAQEDAAAKYKTEHHQLTGKAAPIPMTNVRAFPDVIDGTKSSPFA